MRPIIIWQPKYKTRVALVDKLKVNQGKNYLFFVADRTLPYLYSFDGETVKSKCQLSSNGKIYCYNVPLEWLSVEGELNSELLEIREKEYKKFKDRMNKGKVN